MRLKARSVRAVVGRRGYLFSVSLDTPRFLVRKDGFLFLWGLGSLGWQVAQSSHSFPYLYFMFHSVSCFQVGFRPRPWAPSRRGYRTPIPGKGSPGAHHCKRTEFYFPLGAALTRVKAMGSSFSHFPMFLGIVWPMSFLWSG